MGLVKAADVEYIVSETDLEQEDAAPDHAFGDTDDDTELTTEQNIEMLAPIIIGGDNIDWGTYEYPTADLQHLVFFTLQDTEVTFGDPVLIGGEIGLAGYEIDTGYADDSAIDFAQEEETYDNYQVDEPVEEEVSLLDDFSSMAQSMQHVDAEAEAEAWAKQKNQTMIGRIDDKVKSMMAEQLAALEDASKEQISFMSEKEKQRLLGEAMKSVKESQQNMSQIDLEDVFQTFADFVEQMAMSHQEKLMAEMEEERAQMLGNVEEYIENTLQQQRDVMMQEASDYISRTVQEYKQQLNEDNEFIKAANQLIAQREQILDEAYNKSLTMVQEAEGEASRILEEAFGQQEQANQLIAEAEAQAEMITQEAQSEAERIISEANMESARIIEAAEQSHQEIVEAATQDGFNVGYQEGREEAIKENAQLLMETTNALNKLHAAFPVAVKQNEDKLIKLALQISKDIVQEELTIRPELCMKAVEKAISKVSDLEKVIIKVNPLDLDIVLPKQEYFRKLLPSVQEFVITGHYSIERGGCFIETNSGTVDAQITTQLAVVEEVFQQIRSEYDFSEEEELGGDE